MKNKTLKQNVLLAMLSVLMVFSLMFGINANLRSSLNRKKQSLCQKTKGL